MLFRIEGQTERDDWRGLNRLGLATSASNASSPDSDPFKFIIYAAKAGEQIHGCVLVNGIVQRSSSDCRSVCTTGGVYSEALRGSSCQNIFAVQGSPPKKGPENITRKARGETLCDAHSSLLSL